MKNTITALLLLFSLTAFSQPPTWEQWEKESLSDIRLLPKYGGVEKNKEQKEADKKLIEFALEKDSTRRKASARLISTGFRYLYRDIKTAMYRFNQAYLIDSSNTDVYWGFGAVYMNLGQYQKAREQYEEGLAITPDNPHLLTDYGTYFMAQYYWLAQAEDEHALPNLDSAILYMSKSYELDPSDQATTYKLSIAYWNKGECANAWKYYDECKSLGGEPIAEAFTKDLRKRCKRKKSKK